MENAKTITTSVVVNASKEKVWDALFTRFGETYLFNPNLEGSHFTNGTSGDLGCERQCNLDSKTFIREKIVHADVLKSFSVDVVGGNMPMVKELNVNFNLDESAANQTTVSIQAHFKAKPAFMGVIMKSPFRTRLTNLLIGLKYHLETGKNVSKDTFNPVLKSYRKLQYNQSFN